MLGCSAQRLPDYPTLPLSEYGQMKTQDGVTVAVHPMTDSQETEKYFGMNLLKHDTLVVLVAVENHSPTVNFIIQKDRISLKETLSGGSNKIGQNTSESALAAVTGGAILVCPVAALVTIPFMVQAATNTAEIKRNFAAKELHQETISPGNAKNGFVYFRLPPERSAQMQKTLSISLWDPIGKRSNIFEYQIEIGSK
jgi:hypothetical protein